MFGRGANVTKEFDPKKYYSVDGATLIFYGYSQRAGTSTFEYTIDDSSRRTKIVAEILKSVTGHSGRHITLDPAVTNPNRLVIYLTPPYRETGL